MKAILYELEICEGVIAMVHSCTFKIKEVFVCDANISFNLSDGEISYFAPSKDRYVNAKKLREVDVPDDLVDSFESIIHEREVVTNYAKQWIEDTIPSTE